MKKDKKALVKDGGDKNYVMKDEKHDRKVKKKEERSMSTPGVATALKKSIKEQGKAKLVKVKPQKKV